MASFGLQIDKCCKVNSSWPSFSFSKLCFLVKTLAPNLWPWLWDWPVAEPPAPGRGWRRPRTACRPRPSCASSQPRPGPRPPPLWPRRRQSSESSHPRPSHSRLFLSWKWERHKYFKRQGGRWIQPNVIFAAFARNIILCIINADRTSLSKETILYIKQRLMAGCW